MTKFVMRFILVLLVFSFGYSMAENSSVDELLKTVAKQVKADRLEKATQTLYKAQKESKTESQKTEIDVLYQSIIKAYLRDLDYVSAYDVQKKRSTNLENLNEIKTQKKLNALEKKLKAKIPKIEKEKTTSVKKPVVNKKEEKSNSNKVSSAVFWFVIVIFLGILVFVYLQKNKAIIALKNQLSSSANEPSNVLKTNTTDYKVVELNSKINYLQQQLEIKQNDFKILTNNKKELEDELRELKIEFEKVKNKPEIAPIVAEIPTPQPSISLQNYILPRSEYVKHLFGNHFIFQNQTTINNSLYWFDSIEGNVYFGITKYKNKIYTDIDLNYLLFSFLNRAIHEYGKEKPAEILRQVNTSWLEFISLEDNAELNNQTIDVGICCYNVFSNQLEYSGANNSIFIVREKTKGEKALYVLNADTESVGKQSAQKQYAFTNQIVEVKHGDKLFLMTVENDDSTLINQLQNVFLQNGNAPISETQHQLTLLNLPQVLIVGIEV